VSLDDERTASSEAPAIQSRRISFVRALQPPWIVYITRKELARRRLRPELWFARRPTSQDYGADTCIHGADDPLESGGKHSAEAIPDANSKIVRAWDMTYHPV
jgi:hypothetical protein